MRSYAAWHQRSHKMSELTYFIPSAEAGNAAKVLNFFESLHIETRAGKKAHAFLDAVILAHKNSPQGSAPGIRMFAESHLGKSTIVRDYIRTRIVPRLQAENLEMANLPAEKVVELQREILHVQLKEDATPLSIAQDIVEKLGGTVAGQRGHLWKQAFDLIKNTKVKLLVVDEVQHIATRGKVINDEGVVDTVDLRRTRSSPDALKALMNRGTVPVLFSGTKIAATLLSGSQFNGRAFHQIALKPHNWTIAEDKAEFVRFLGLMALEIEKAGFVDEVPQLVHGQTPRNLYVAAGGRLGFVCKIVQQALLELAFSGRRVMTLTDLSEAVDQFVALGEADVNPFHATQATLELA